MCLSVFISFVDLHLTYISFFLESQFLVWTSDFGGLSALKSAFQNFDRATSNTQTLSARTVVSTMSSYTSEIVVGSAIVAALGVAAYWVIRPTSAQPDENLPSTTQKKQPKKKKSALQDSQREKPPPPSPVPRIPKAVPANVPGGFGPLDNDELSAASGSNAGTAKKKKKKPVKKATENSATATPLGRPVLAGTAAASTQQQYLSPEYSTQESKTDKGPWTRVESRRKTPSGATGSASDAGVTSSVTEEEGSITEKQERPAEEKLTLAEKLLPRPVETAVDECVHLPPYCTCHC